METIAIVYFVFYVAFVVLTYYRIIWDNKARILKNTPTTTINRFPFFKLARKRVKAELFRTVATIAVLWTEYVLLYGFNVVINMIATVVLALLLLRIHRFSFFPLHIPDIKIDFGWNDGFMLELGKNVIVMVLLTIAVEKEMVHSAFDWQAWGILFLIGFFAGFLMSLTRKFLVVKFHKMPIIHVNTITK